MASYRYNFRIWVRLAAFVLLAVTIRRNDAGRDGPRGSLPSGLRGRGGTGGVRLSLPDRAAHAPERDRAHELAGVLPQHRRLPALSNVEGRARARDRRAAFTSGDLDRVSTVPARRSTSTRPVREKPRLEMPPEAGAYVERGGRLAQIIGFIEKGPHKDEYALEDAVEIDPATGDNRIFYRAPADLVLWRKVRGAIGEALAQGVE